MKARRRAGRGWGKVETRKQKVEIGKGKGGEVASDEWQVASDYVGGLSWMRSRIRVMVFGGSGRSAPIRVNEWRGIVGMLERLNVETLGAKTGYHG